MLRIRFLPVPRCRDPLAPTEEVVIAEPVGGSADGETIAGSRTVAERQSAAVESDGTVTTSYQRVEDETLVARRRPNWLWLGATV